MIRLAVFIGKFDPITNKHIVFSKALLSEQFDHIYFLPVNQSDDTQAKHRRMCEIAFSSEEHISLLDVEREQIKKSFQSVVKLIKALHPDNKLSFIAEEGFIPPKGYPIIPFEGDSAAAVKQIGHFNDTGLIPPDVLAFIATEGLYQPCDDRKLRETLSKGRYQHTMGVRSTAVELARRFKAPMIKSSVAAFYHDCAKEMPVKDMRRICLTALHKDKNDEILESGALMHGHVGAYLTDTVYGIHDEGILNAIRYHTTGRVGMTDLEMAVFLADAIEPNRSDYPGLKEIRELSKESMKAAVLLSLCLTKAHVLDSGRVFHPSGDETIDWLLKECNENEKAMTKRMLNQLKV